MRPTFHIVDYIVFAGSILTSLGIGVYFAFSGRKEVDNKEFLTGGRNMKLIPIAISLVVSFLSTISILGNPAEVYVYGTQYMWYLLALVTGTVYGTLLFVPLYYPLQITSVFEYTRMRFNARYVEYTAIGLAMLNMLVLNGIFIYSPCVAFQGVSGFPAWISMIICGITATIYTSLGGMKSVVWTDVFQAVIIIIGLLAIAIKGTIEVGGIREVWAINERWNRVQMISLDPTIRLTFWSVCVMNSMLWMCMIGAQPSVQRFVSLPTMRKAKITTMIIIPGFLLSGSLTCSCGVTAFAYYAKKGCDPLMSGMISSPNEILPFFVMDVLDIPSIPGLFIASLFCASLSSISSTFSGMGAIMWQNILQPRYGHLSSKKQANITRLCTGMFGVVSVAFAFLVMGLGGTLIQITYSVIGAIAGPLIGMTLVGAMIPQVGAKATMLGTVLALGFSLWVGIGAVFYSVYDPPLPAPTHNCTFSPAMQGLNHNVGVKVFDSNTTDSSSYDAADNRLMSSVNGSDAGSLLTPAHQTKSTAGVQWLYSVSYFYYPFFGISIVFIVCCASLLIPACRQSELTPKKLLFPCLRRFCGGPNPEDESLDTKQNLLNGNQYNIELKEQIVPAETHPMTLQTPRDDDLWQPRDEVKRRSQMRHDLTTESCPRELTHQEFY